MTNSSVLNLLNLSSTGFNQETGKLSKSSEGSGSDSFLSLLTQQLTFSAGNGSSAFNSKTSSLAAFSPGKVSSGNELRPSFSKSNFVTKKDIGNSSERREISDSFAEKANKRLEESTRNKVDDSKEANSDLQIEETDEEKESIARKSAEKIYDELITDPDIANFLQGMDKNTALDLIQAIQAAPEAEITEILNNPEAIMEGLTELMEEATNIDESEMAEILASISSSESMASLANMLEKNRPEINHKLSDESSKKASIEGINSESLKTVEDTEASDTNSDELKTETSDKDQIQEKKAETHKEKSSQAESKIEDQKANSDNGTLKYRSETSQKENSASLEGEISEQVQTSSETDLPETKVADSFQSELTNMLISSDTTDDSLKKKLVSAMLQKVNNSKNMANGVSGEATYGPKPISGNKSSFLNQNGNQGFANGGNANGTTSSAGSAAESRSTGSLANSVFAQLMEKAELIKAPDGKKVLNIELDPKELGKMEMELTSKDGTVSARISAENSDVKSQLDELLPKIKEQLNEQGINLVEITVDISSKHPDEKNRNQMFEGKHKSISGSKIGSNNGEELIRKNVLPHLRRRALNIQAIDLTV